MWKSVGFLPRAEEYDVDTKQEILSHTYALRIEHSCYNTIEPMVNNYDTLLRRRSEDRRSSPLRWLRAFLLIGPVSYECGFGRCWTYHQRPHGYTNHGKRLRVKPLSFLVLPLA